MLFINFYYIYQRLYPLKYHHSQFHQNIKFCSPFTLSPQYLDVKHFIVQQYLAGGFDTINTRFSWDIYKRIMDGFGSRYAITFGEVGIVHYGAEEIGKQAEQGFSVEQLKQIRDKAESQFNCQAVLYNLTQKLPANVQQGHEAAVLHLKGFADKLIGEEDISDKLYEQQEHIEYDKKYYDAKKNKTFNKRARFNMVFGEESQKPTEDYKSYTITAFNDLKLLSLVRQRIGEVFGDKAYKLLAQGNRYYEEGSGIGFHGDSQRKIVICLSLGRQSVLRYFWRKPGCSDNLYGPIDLKVNHGDIYIMSEKATGNDWRKSSRYRLVHAAGSLKYIGK